MSQIDLAPTLARLFNTPIPRDSAGLLIPELLYSPGTCMGVGMGVGAESLESPGTGTGTGWCMKKELLDNLYVNAQQVWSSVRGSSDVESEFQNRWVGCVEAYGAVANNSSSVTLEYELDACIGCFTALLSDIQGDSRYVLC